MQSPDLLALKRRGSLPDANVMLVLTDDGYAKCLAAKHARGRPLPDPSRCRRASSSARSFADGHVKPPVRAPARV